jgi:hypothetical protein
MPVYPVIDSSALRLAAKQVKAIDPDIRKRLIQGLKSDLAPTGARIAALVPRLGVPGSVRGFGHKGRTGWGNVKASTHITPGGGKGAVARFEIYTSPNQAALKIADLAGTKGQYNNGNYSKGGLQPYFINGQGEDLVSRLTKVSRLSAGGKGGRFVWANFMRERPALIRKVEASLATYAEQISRGIGRGGSV